MPITTTKTRQVADSNITYAKVQDISAANIILGRYTSGAGVAQELLIGAGLSISGSSLIANISGTTGKLAKFTGTNTLGDSIVSEIGAGVTVAGEVSATAFNIGNGQYFTAVRNSGSLPINLLGIEAGTDDTRLLITGDFNIKTGALSTLFKVAQTGVITINTAPTTSAGTYDILTRNTSTGAVEKVTSSGAFIQNQSASAQTASMWITGDVKTNGKVYIGANGAYIEEVLVGSTYELRVVDSAGNTTVIS